MFFVVIKAVLARTLFAIHAIVSVWRVVDIKQGDPTYWLLSIGVVCLAVEGLVSICKQRGRELKWFSPSVFIYLCCIIPPMWILELDLAYSRTSLRSDGGVLYQQAAIGRNRSKDFPALEMVINVQLPSELWTKLLEQFLMVNLILGRWLLPKGGLTRNQLSQLLLVYIGMAADIVELFEAFKEEVVLGSLELTYVILSLWTWSLLQFTLVLTATKARKPRPGVDSSSPKERSTCDGQSRLRRCCNIDIWAMMTTIVFQDGPFLGLRLVLIIKYNVVSYFNIFFTCKNSLVLLLQVYRLIVLSCEKQKNWPKGVGNDKECKLGRKEADSHQCRSGFCCPDDYNEFNGYSSSYDRRPPSSYRTECEDRDYLDRSYESRDELRTDNDWFKQPFNKANSVFVAYTQSRDAPWTDVQLLLRSANSSNSDTNNKERRKVELVKDHVDSEDKRRCSERNVNSPMKEKKEDVTPRRKFSKKLCSISKRHGSRGVGAECSFAGSHVGSTRF